METEQNGSIQLKQLPGNQQIHGVNEHAVYRPQRCQSVPVKDLRSHYCSDSISNYRPNSSHQYLSPVALKDSTIQETNIRLGKPTRTS